MHFLSNSASDLFLCIQEKRCLGLEKKIALWNTVKNLWTTTNLVNPKIVIVVDGWSLLMGDLCNTSSKWDLNIVVVVGRWSLAQVWMYFVASRWVTRRVLNRSHDCGIWANFRLYYRGGQSTVWGPNLAWWFTWSGPRSSIFHTVSLHFMFKKNNDV